MLVLHRAALLAFLWLTVTGLASYFGVLDLRIFVSHLPPEISGKWGASRLASTAWNTPGTSSIVVLLLAGLTLTTVDYRKKWPVVILVILLGASMVFLSGSRQGVVRFAAFIFVLLSRGARRHTLALVCIILVGLFLVSIRGGLEVPQTSQTEWAMSRQSRLVDNPLSNEALSGRPKLSRRAIDLLNHNPLAVLVGWPINSALTGHTIPEGVIVAPHNMILALLFWGGIVALLVYVLCYGGMFRCLWRIRRTAWPMVAVTAGMLTSTLTSGIFVADLSTGWYLGFYFVCLHIAASASSANEPHATEDGTAVPNVPEVDG